MADDSIGQRDRADHLPAADRDRFGWCTAVRCCADGGVFSEEPPLDLDHLYLLRPLLWTTLLGRSCERAVAAIWLAGCIVGGRHACAVARNNFGRVVAGIAGISRQSRRQTAGSRAHSDANRSTA